MATSGWLRNAASVAVGASLLLTSAALPMLDRDMFLTGERIETEHSSSGCAYVHDHVLCVQWAGSRWIASPPRPGFLRAKVVHFADEPPTQPALASTPRLRPSSRAPPAA